MTPSEVRNISTTSANKYTLLTKVIEKLATTNKNFKYIVHVVIVAKGGNGLDLGGLFLWNPDMDGSISVKWEGKFMTCITTVYGIAN